MRSSPLCPACAPICGMIAAGAPDDAVLQRLLDEGRLQLYAANCQPKDFAYWMDRGSHYTMNAAFYCPHCGQYYYAGYCLYGRPVVKEYTPELARRLADRLEWGYLGTALHET